MNSNQLQSNETSFLFSNKPDNGIGIPQPRKENPKDVRRREYLKLERDLSRFPDDSTIIGYLKNLSVDNICQVKQLS
jgi:hypothetical protein